MDFYASIKATFQYVIWFLVALFTHLRDAVVTAYSLVKDGREELANVLYKPSPRNQFILENCRTLRTKFKGPWWAVNGHIETVATLLRRREKFEHCREIVELPDGGRQALDYITGIGSKVFNISDCPFILMVIPGLTSGADSYTEMYAVAHKYNMIPVVFNKRGHGGTKISTPKLQSFGDSADLRYCVCHLKLKYPQKKFVGIGYSAGSGLLAKYMATYEDSPILLGAAMNSPGYDCTKIFGENGVIQPYNAILTRELKRKIVKPNENQLAQVIDIEKVLQSPNLHALEANLYCRLYGYKDLDEYFLYNNPATDLLKGSAPYMCINSLNDPICLEEYIPFHHFPTSEYGLLVTTKRGGHCGWRESGSGDVWADKLAIEFLQACINYN